MSDVLILTRATLRKALREKSISLTLVVMVLGMLLVGNLESTEAGKRVKLLTELGLNLLDAFGFLMALVVNHSLVPMDIASRSIYFPLARPLTRSRYITARWLAVVILVSANVAFLGLVLQGTLIVVGGEVDPNLLAGVVVSLLKMSLYASVLMFLGTLFTPLVSLFGGVLAWVVLHTLDLLTSSLTHTGVAALDRVMSWVVWALPDLSHYSLQYVLVHHVTIPWWFVGLLALYTGAYAILMLVLASWALEARDL